MVSGEWVTFEDSLACFLSGYSKYNYVHIYIKDQKKYSFSWCVFVYCTNLKIETVVLYDGRNSRGKWMRLKPSIKKQNKEKEKNNTERMNKDPWSSKALFIYECFLVIHSLSISTCNLFLYYIHVYRKS